MAILAINLKSYAESAQRTLRICQIAAESSSDVEIIVAPNAFFLSEAAKTCTTYAQHVDDLEATRNTGFLPFEMAKLAGARGAILNHSEHRLDSRTIQSLIVKLRSIRMSSLVCARDDEEAARIAKLGPDYIAVEPPELIGGDVSISSADPGLIDRSVKAVHDVDESIGVLVGAGVRAPEDIRIALERGAIGVLLASEVAKSTDPEGTIERLLTGF